MIKEKLIKWLLTEFNLSMSDVEKVKSILDKIEIKEVGDNTIISVRLDKFSVVLEAKSSAY